MALSITTLSTNDAQHNGPLHNSIKCLYAEGRIFFIVMLSVIMPTVTMLNVAMLSVTSLTAAMLNVVMLSVIMLRVVAP
jgi:hypothetical protein